MLNWHKTRYGKCQASLIAEWLPWLDRPYPDRPENEELAWLLHREEYWRWNLENEYYPDWVMVMTEMMRQEEILINMQKKPVMKVHGRHKFASY